MSVERKTVKLMGVLEVETVRSPSGEFRIEKSQGAIALGYAAPWMAQLFRSEATLQALKGKGFTAESIAIGDADTMSISDFVKLVQYAAERGNELAKAYVAASVERSTTDDIREAWGEERLSLEERRAMFYKAIAAQMSETDWKAGDGTGGGGKIGSVPQALSLFEAADRGAIDFDVWAKEYDQADCDRSTK